MRHNLWQNLKVAARVWYDADGDHKAATVSYYMIFAMVPLLLLSVAIHSLLFGRHYIVSTLNDWGSVLGNGVTELLTEAVRNLESLSGGFSVPFTGIIFFTGMVIVMFNTFTTGIHDVWGIRQRGFKGWLRKSRHSIIFIMVFELYLFCTLAVSYGLSLIPSLPFVVVLLVDAVFFLSATTILFSLAFTVLPWESPKLRSCLHGAFVASVLLYLARALVSLYIELSPVPGLFGVAGLMVVLLIWVFACAAIIYYGAAYAYVHAGKQLR